MPPESAAANYRSALSYLKLNLKDPATDTLKLALSQVSANERRGDNSVYLGILSALALLSLERADFEGTWNYVDQGLSAKSNHLDLLFLRSVLLMDQKRYDEMLEALILYLLALGERDDRAIYDYRYAHEGAFEEVFDRLLPMAYGGAREATRIRAIVEKLSGAAANEWITKAYDVMVQIDHATRDEGER